MEFGVTILPDPPHTRLLELLERAEANGFQHGWTYDSHVLWQECSPLLTMMALRTRSMKVGLCVTNPGTRDPSVVASLHATLQDISGGRVVCGIGRGDSARRVIGQEPVRVAQFEQDCRTIRELMNGRPVTVNDTEIQLEWAKGLPQIPLYVAGYGPKVLSIAGRVSDGVIIQLADPDIVDWIMGIARRAAAEAGRDPDALQPIVSAPAFVSDDLAHARDQVRWFPAMVSNHVVDLLRKYPKEELPDSLVRYVEQREFYDYKDHSRVGAEHGQFVDDETCDRFCILGTPEQHVEKLKRLEAVGVSQWNIYLMTHDQERTLDLYGREIVPNV
ncbi:MAG: TIGR03842 family LLM class F420-dependent oxidoreductase [Thermoleophilia bacterium]